MAVKEIWVCDRCAAEQDPKGCANATQGWATLTTENHGKVTTRYLKKLICPKVRQKARSVHRRMIARRGAYVYYGPRWVLMYWNGKRDVLLPFPIPANDW